MKPSVRVDLRILLPFLLALLVVFGNALLSFNSLSTLIDTQDRHARIEAQSPQLFGNHHELHDTLAQTRSATRWVMLTVGVGLVLNAVLLVALYVHVARALTKQRRNEEAALTRSRELDTSLQQIEQYTLRNSRMNEMSKLLQVCNDMAEALKVVSAYLPPLLPGTSAGLYLYASSRNYLELVSNWGESEFDRHILPDDCWALRKGQIFYNHPTDGGNPLSCAHERNGHSGCCVPLTAQGEIVGLFTLHYSTEQPPDSLLLSSIGEHVSLAISNIQLKSALRQQSIKDPLTGLNNRRLFEDALNRELARLTRTGKTLAVIMMDIDHFKRYNDTYGHEAGDHVLIEVAQALTSFTRSSDVVCRYGGEEFCLLLPEANQQSALDRAEELRRRIAGLHMKRHGISLDSISMSFGVAVAPMHGDTVEQLVREADIALYRAKAAGRNRVELAELPPPEEEATEQS
jgi:diguanylate cyclase (GGDEF)-like protein